jgi:branched-chain amino acid transport system permease protein
MTRYADRLPMVAAPGSADGSVGPTEAARYLYGAAIVLVLLYAPDGLHGLTRRLGARLKRRRPPVTSRSATATSCPAPASAARPKEHTP